MAMSSVSIRVSTALFEEIRTTATKEDVSLIEAADHLVVGLQTKNERLQKENAKLKNELEAAKKEEDNLWNLANEFKDKIRSKEDLQTWNDIATKHGYGKK